MSLYGALGSSVFGGSKAEAEDLESYTKEIVDLFRKYPTFGPSSEPSWIYDNLFLGTASNAANIKCLQRLQIKYVLNCGGISILRPDREQHYDKESGVVEYEEFPSLDDSTYDMKPHIMRAQRFIDRTRAKGRVLVFCPDVNRSYCICMAYLMSRGMTLLDAAIAIKKDRKTPMTNINFIRQLVVMARDSGTIQVPRPKGGAALILAADEASGSALRYRPRKSNPRPQPLDPEILNYEVPEPPRPKLRPLSWYSSRELQRKDIEYTAPKVKSGPPAWAPGPFSFYQDEKRSFNRDVSPARAVSQSQSQSRKSRWELDEDVNFILPRSRYVPPTPYAPRVNPRTPLRVEVEPDYSTSRYSSSSSSAYSSLLAARKRNIYYSDLEPIEYPAPRARKYEAPAYKSSASSLYLDLDAFKYTYTPPRPSYVAPVSRPRPVYEDLDTYEYTPPRPRPSYEITEYTPSPRYVPRPTPRPVSLYEDLDTYEYTPPRPRPRYEITEYTAPTPRYVPPPRPRPRPMSLYEDLDTYEFTPSRPTPRYEIIEYRAPTPRYVPPPRPRPSAYLDLAEFEYTPPKPSYVPSSVYKPSSSSFFNSDLKAIDEYTPPRPQYVPVVYTPPPRPQYEAIEYTPPKPRYTPPVYRPSSSSILNLDMDEFVYNPPKPSYVSPVPKARPSSWYSDMEYTLPTVRYEPAPPPMPAPRPIAWYTEPEPVVRKVPPKPVHGSVTPVSWMSESDYRASTRVSKISPTEKSSRTYNYDDAEPHGRGPKVLSVQVTVM